MPAPLGPSYYRPTGHKPGDALTAPVTPDKRMPVVDMNKVDPQIREAAQGMEAMFLNYMLKVMRDTVPKQDMDLESPATQMYRGLQDNEFAQRAAKAGGIGLAEQIVAYLEAQRYNLPRGQGVPADVHGGTHEGRHVSK